MGGESLFVLNDKKAFLTSTLDGESCKGKILSDRTYQSLVTTIRESGFLINSIIDESRSEPGLLTEGGDGILLNLDGKINQGFEGYGDVFSPGVKVLIAELEGLVEKDGIYGDCDYSAIYEIFIKGLQAGIQSFQSE